MTTASLNQRAIAICRFGEAGCGRLKPGGFDHQGRALAIACHRLHDAADAWAGFGPGHTSEDNDTPVASERESLLQPVGQTLLLQVLNGDRLRLEDESAEPDGQADLLPVGDGFQEGAAVHDDAPIGG